MSPPSSSDSGPVPPQVFSTPAPDVAPGNPAVAETLQPPPAPAAPSSLPFSTAAPHPSVIPSPSPCQSPPSPIHQSQPRTRIRSRTPPLSLRPSHFATSIIPQNTRRRLRLRRSLNNAPLPSTPPSSSTRPLSHVHNHNNNSSNNLNSNNSNLNINNNPSSNTLNNPNLPNSSPPPWSSVLHGPPDVLPLTSNNAHPTPDPSAQNPHTHPSTAQFSSRPVPSHSLDSPNNNNNNSTNNSNNNTSVPLPPHPLSQFGPARSGATPYSSSQPSLTSPNSSRNAYVRSSTGNSSRAPRSTAIDELIAVLERNAPPLPAVRSVIARSNLPSLNQSQSNGNQQQQSRIPYQHHHQHQQNELPFSNQSFQTYQQYPQQDHQRHDASSSQLPAIGSHNNNNNPSPFTNTPGVSAPSYSGGAISASLSTHMPEPQGLACIPSAQQPSHMSEFNTPSSHRQTGGSTIHPPSTHSLFSNAQDLESPNPSSPFISNTNGNNGNNNNNDEMTPGTPPGTDRPRWCSSSGATSTPSVSAPTPSAPTLPFPQNAESIRPASTNAGVSNNFGPPQGVPTSLWPMPPLTRDNSLPPMTSGPVQRGISPYRSSMRHSHLSNRVLRPFPRDSSMGSLLTPASGSNNQSNNGNNNNNSHHPLPPFAAPSLRSVERHNAAEPDTGLISAHAPAPAFRWGGSDDDPGRGRERERERISPRGRRLSDVVMDDEVMIVGTSSNPNNSGPLRAGHVSTPASTHSAHGGASGRRSVSFNISGGGSGSGMPIDLVYDERRQADENSVQPVTSSSGAAPSPFGSYLGQAPPHADGNMYGEHFRRARMSRVLRLVGNSARRGAQASDDMRLIFGDDDDMIPGVSTEVMNAIGLRHSSRGGAASGLGSGRAFTTSTSHAGMQPSGLGSGGSSDGVNGARYGFGGGEGRDSEGVRPLMVGDIDSDIMMGEFDAIDYLQSLNNINHPRHRDRERDRDRMRDHRDREYDHQRSRGRASLMRVARGGVLRQMARLSRMPPMESMLRRCEVRAMVAGREFGVPCGLFEYSVRGRPSLTPSIDWPDVMLISDENVKPRAPILDLMAESHVNWCVRVGPLGNGEGDGRRGYQAFVGGLIDGGFAIKLEITRGVIYLWALTFPPHGQCLLGVFRSNSVPPCTNNNNNAPTASNTPSRALAPATTSSTPTIPATAAAPTGVTSNMNDGNSDNDSVLANTTDSASAPAS